MGSDSSALVARRTMPIPSVTPSGTCGGTVEIVVDGERDAGQRWLLRALGLDDVRDLVGSALP